MHSLYQVYIILKKLAHIGQISALSYVHDGAREAPAYLLVLLGVLGKLVEQLDGLLHQVLPDDAEDLVLLQALARDVERQVLRVHDTLHELQVLRHQVLAVVHDEHSPHVPEQKTREHQKHAFRVSTF